MVQNTSTITRSSRTDVGRQFPLTKQNKAGASNSSYRRPEQMQLAGMGTAQPARGSRGSSPTGTQARSSSSSEQSLNNQAILIGRIGRDATIHRTQKGNLVANFMIGVEERHKDQRGWRTKSSWHRVQAWNELAESLGPSLQQGMPVRVEGRLVNRVWIDQNDQRRFYTEIIARDVRLLDATPGTDARTSRDGDGYKRELQ